MDITVIMDIKEKTKRFTSGKFSFNDYLSVSSYFKNEENNEALKKCLEDDWYETENGGDNKERLARILVRLHQKINLKSKFKTNSFQTFNLLFSKVAVVLIIPALITIAVLSFLKIKSSVKADSWAEIYSPVGSRTKFQLPDGTQGWLNSGSSIKYAVDFMHNRKVGISGEAWLDVAHLSSKEFRVITQYFDVKVSGTQFNVIAYDDEATAGVILEKGKVIVIGKDKVDKGELKPDQQLLYNKSTRQFIKTNIDSKNYTSWKGGLLIFKNVLMSEIAIRLERKYNTEIILHGDALKSSIFRATFEDENLEEICKMLSTVAPIRYKIHKREKLSDDTFSKSKVEMWLRNNTELK
jgi:transmembrane sensor